MSDDQKRQHWAKQVKDLQADTDYMRRQEEKAARIAQMFILKAKFETLAEDILNNETTEW